MVLTDARLATFDGAAPYGLIDDGSIAMENGVIRWVGPRLDLPIRYKRWLERKLDGRLITPALIDCHTHLVFGGSRHQEFEQRLQGVSYADIAKAGGGINATVEATRGTDEDTLFAHALARVDQLMSEGVGTIEIKSGYGLDRETELRQLRVARRIVTERHVGICTTFLGAHAVPNAYRDRPDAYLDEVCLPTLDAAVEAGLVDAVDGFCEGIAFTPAQIERVFERARHHGLPVKLHAEQLTLTHGAALAARHGALSADHLEYLDADGIEAMRKAGTVAVLLPGAFYFLGETQAPPIRGLRDAGVPIAVATDLNPGSSPLASLLVAINMACTLFRLTPDEALAGVTRHAAAALGLRDRGRLAPGCRADLALWEVEHPAQLAWGIGINPLSETLYGGAP